MSFLSSIVLFRDFYGTNLELFNFRSGHEGGGGIVPFSFTGMDQGWRNCSLRFVKQRL